MVTLLIRLLVVMFLIGIVYISTTYGTTLREGIHGAKEAVAGANTSTEIGENVLPQKLKEDTEEGLKELQENILEVKIGEIFSFFARTDKIIDDFHSVQKEVTEKLEVTDTPNE